jgi:ABC-type multidrug transport system fused ATPase/permease subunit
LFGFLEERLSGTEDIRANGATAYVLRQHIERTRALFRAALKEALLGVLSWRTAKMLLDIGAAIGLAVGAVLFLDGALTLGTVYVIFAYTEMLGHPIDQILHEFGDLQQATASIGRVQEMFDTRSSLIQPTQADAQALPSGPLSAEMCDVTFAYPGDDTVLHNVTVHLEAGSTLGVLGRTGSGKTTLTRLLLRLYDPASGQVRIGGIDARHIHNDDLRQRVAVVTQDIQLFSASVRDNLTLFDVRVPDDHIQNALTMVGLEDWVRELPRGLNTVLASGGVGLSAGQAQLLAFARAFLRNPGLVILDEASSRLDPATEQKLEQAVQRLLAGRTGIIIAHRLRTLDRVQQILILDDGRVSENGPREELVRDEQSRFSQLLKTGIEKALV